MRKGLNDDTLLGTIMNEGILPIGTCSLSVLPFDYRYWQQSCLDFYKV